MKIIPKFQEGNVVYVEFPLHKIATPIGKKLPLGHAGIMYIDNDGHTKYYEYGRYDPRIAYGNSRKSTYEGNWVKRTVPDMKRGESYESYIERFKRLFNEPVTFRVAKTDDVSKVQKFIDDSANDSNRKSYNWYSGGDFEHSQSCGGLARRAFDAGRSGIGEWADNVADWLMPLNLLPTGHYSLHPHFGTKTVKSK